MGHSLIVEGRKFQISPNTTDNTFLPYVVLSQNLTVSSITGPGAQTSQSPFPYEFIQRSWSKTMETLIYKTGKSKSFFLNYGNLKKMFFKGLAYMEGEGFLIQILLGFFIERFYWFDR